MQREQVQIKSDIIVTNLKRGVRVLLGRAYNLCRNRGETQSKKWLICSVWGGGGAPGSSPMAVVGGGGGEMRIGWLHFNLLLFSGIWATARGIFVPFSVPNTCTLGGAYICIRESGKIPDGRHDLMYINNFSVILEWGWKDSGPLWCHFFPGNITHLLGCQAPAWPFNHW